MGLPCRIVTELPFLESLVQCLNVTWDGDLISSRAVQCLSESGLVDRFEGFNIITVKGLKLLYNNNSYVHKLINMLK